MTLRVLDLFSGIGGFSLGLEQAGMRTVAFCELDPYCRRVLARHWPEVPIYDDVRTLTADALRRDGVAVDLICGGFPCQDISYAGGRHGLEGARSGLWREYARLVRELRPRFVVVENVSGLLSLGFGDVLGDLAEIGYDATWDCIPAAAVGAPHGRDRLWVVAHTHGHRQQGGLSQGFPRRTVGATVRPVGRTWPPRPEAVGDIPRMVDGVRHRVDRLRALGNAVVPQIPALIGRSIMAAVEHE